MDKRSAALYVKIFLKEIILEIVRIFVGKNRMFMKQSAKQGSERRNLETVITQKVRIFCEKSKNSSIKKRKKGVDNA